MPSFWRVAVLALGACAAWSQITTGALSGAVTDPAGAAVVGAKVAVANQATGVVTPLITNEAGQFKAAFPIPGTYTVRIQALGFQTFEEKDVAVELAHEPLVNAALVIGAASETVEVRSIAPLLVADTAQLSTDVQPDAVLTLGLPPCFETEED